MVGQKYMPYASVWEITMGCNMRCKHCGSSCKDKLEDELTTKEAMNVCKQLGELGIKYVTLTGGEPTTRSDWKLIVEELRKYDIQVNIISNGWLVDEKLAKQVKEAGIYNFGISLDGLQYTHDYMRREGAFNQVMKAIDNLKNNDMIVSIVTTINKRNLPELEELKKILISKDVDAWQLQYAMPMGEFHKRREEMLIDNTQIDDIINFAYENKDEIDIFLGDCIGYYSKKEMEVRKALYNEDYIWMGCPIGKSIISLLNNGDILGCTALRDRQFIEGNIRNKSLKEIWDNGFIWSREMKQSDLKGTCYDCKYGEVCLGGCSISKFTANGSVHCENEYCIYGNALRREIEKAPNKDVIEEKGTQFIDQRLKEKRYDEVALYIRKLLKEEIKKEERDYLLQTLHYTLFKMGKYSESLDICKSLLEKNDKDQYALHGLILNMINLGKKEEAMLLLNPKILSEKEIEELNKDIKIYEMSK